MKYKILFMDADDTLLDFQKCEYMAIQDTFCKYDLIFNETVFDIYKRHNHSLWAAFERGEITKTEILAKRFRETFEELGYLNVPSTFEKDYQLALGNGGYIIEGADEALCKLCEKCDIFILTNGVGETQRSRMAKSGLLPYVKGLFISEELGAQKPQKEYFEAVLEKLGDVDKDSILMIGDSLGSDIQGGINAGIDTCWYNPYHKISDLPTYEVHSMQELCNLILLEEDVSNEVWDLYDENGVLQELKVKRGERIPLGYYHLVSEVWVISGDKILLTRRHPNKPYGGMYECTGGSMVSGENTLQGACRELQEEIGLTVSEDELMLIGTKLGVNFIFDTFIVKKEVDLSSLKLLETEVISAILVDYSTLLNMMEEKKIGPSIIERFKRYQKDWEKASSLVKG